MWESGEWLVEFQYLFPFDSHPLPQQRLYLFGFIAKLINRQLIRVFNPLLSSHWIQITTTGSSSSLPCPWWVVQCRPWWIEETRDSSVIQQSQAKTRAAPYFFYANTNPLGVYQLQCESNRINAHIPWIRVTPLTSLCSDACQVERILAIKGPFRSFSPPEGVGGRAVEIGGGVTGRVKFKRIDLIALFLLLLSKGTDTRGTVLRNHNSING